MMKNFSTELKVGIFAIIVIFTLSYMTFKVGSLPMLWEEGYRLHVVLNDINGLDEKSRIKIAGVDAGIVDRITLEDGKAHLIVLVEPEIKLYSNAQVSLKMSGLLGDKYLSLTTGTSDQKLLGDGDSIITTSPVADIDELANHLTAAAANIGDLTRNINSIFGETEKASIREAIHNLKVMTANMKDISGENREPLRNIIAQLEVFTDALSKKGPGAVDDISQVAKNINTKLPDLVDRLNAAAEGLKGIIDENRDALKDSMENIRTASKATSNIVERIDRGEGTLGKLVKEDDLYQSLDKITSEAGKALDFAGRIRTFMAFSSEYSEGDSEWKGMFNLTLQPAEDKYYILGVVDDKLGAVTTTKEVTNGVEEIKEETESKIEFSAQIAKRFDDFAVRVGMLENTFGFGADAFLLEDRVRLKFEIWDFAEREADAENAHAKIGIDYTMFKYLLLSGGIDNFLNENRRGVYVGAGFQFEDEDFKYLLGQTPSLPID